MSPVDPRIVAPAPHVAGNAAGAIVVYGTSWCGDCRRSERVFAALRVPFTYVDIEEEDGATQLVLRLNAGKRRVPTIVFPDGEVLAEPSNRALEARLAAYVGA